MSGGCEELLVYLKHSNVKVRKEATNIALSLSGDASFVHDSSLEIIPCLLQIALNDEQELSDIAFPTLVNLSDNPKVSELLGTSSSLSSICECLQEKHLIGPASTASYICMLLSNITRCELSLLNFIKQEVFLWRIFGYYLALTENPHASRLDESHSFGDIFLNVTSCHEGRKWLSEMDESVWEKLSQLTRIDNKHRTIILQLVKNICCDVELTIDFSRVRIFELLCRLIYPSSTIDGSISGCLVPVSITSKSFGLVQDSESRKFVAECFYCLLRSKHAREYARSINLYEVLRLWHTMEDDDDIKSINEEMVHLVHYSEEELQQQDGPGPPDSALELQ